MSKSSYSYEHDDRAAIEANWLMDENAELRAELERLRPLADAAMAYRDFCEGWYANDAERAIVLAVDDYRKAQPHVAL